MSEFEGWLIGQWFIALLNAFLETHPTACTVGMDIGFRLAFFKHVSVRRPDFAVILNRNPVGIQLSDASYKGTYDLCVEVLSHTSPKGITRDTVEKKREYASAGVQEYYILDSHRKETRFYRLGRNRNYQPIQPVKGDMIQSGVLPGFQFRIQDLYGRPSLEVLMRDPVYQHYVLPGYQQAEQRAEQEKQRAERTEALLTQEKQRAEQEKHRAEQAEQQAAKFAARLKELGISPD